MLLNGTIIDDCSTNGPGVGEMKLTAPGRSKPYTFTQYGYFNDNGAQNVVVSTGFIAGENQLQLIINNTYQGIYGPVVKPRGGDMESFEITGTVNY